MSASVGPQTPTLSPPQGKESYSQLAEFTLSLIQAVLRTGYYAADHPEAKKALGHLYNQFKSALGDRYELSFLVAQARDSRDIVIEGYEAVPLTLHKVMLRGMADLFAPKFLAFFDRWGLLSFSIKPNCAAKDFNAFVELMSQPPASDVGTMNASDRLTEAFVERQIVSISTVFKHDIIGRERRLPWRVEMALSRMRRDLTLLPLYKQATPEELNKIKLQIIDDVTRPMRTPDLLRDFLVNCDLVADDIALLEENHIEREIVQNVNEDMLVQTARLIVADLETVDPNQGKAEADAIAQAKERQVTVLREIANKLCRIGSAIEHGFLEMLFKQGLLSFDDLSPEVKEAMSTRRMTEKFVARRVPYVEGLSRIGTDKAGRDLAALVHRIFPELLRLGEYETAALIVGAVSGERVSGILKQLAGLLSQVTGASDMVSQLLRELPLQGKSGRGHVVDLLAFAGQPASEGLRHLFVMNQDKMIRMATFEALRRMGPKVIGPFLARIPQIEERWDVLHQILASLAETGDASLAKPTSHYIHHSNVHVRHAALNALFKQLGADGESFFLTALGDEEAEVRQTAAAYLGEIRSTHPQALEFYSKVLMGDDEAGATEADAVLVQVCVALENISTVADDGVAGAQHMLMGGLYPIERKGVRNLLKKSAPRHTDRVREAIYQTLGRIGTRDVLESLEKIAATEGGTLAKIAAEACRELEQRTSITASLRLN